jgi:hypothetical protein
MDLVAAGKVFPPFFSLRQGWCNHICVEVAIIERFLWPMQLSALIQYNQSESGLFGSII